MLFLTAKLKGQVTRQPNADELAEGLSFDQARAREASFFKEVAPWKGLDVEMRSRLGTKNLSASLSEQLLAFIRKR